MGGPRVDRLGRLPWRETTRDSDAVRYSLVYSRRCRLTTPRWDGGLGEGWPAAGPRNNAAETDGRSLPRDVCWDKRSCLAGLAAVGKR